MIGIVSLGRGLVREPVVHFLLLGAALFAVQGWLAPPPEPAVADDGRQIVVTAADLDRIALEQAARTGRRPDGEELRRIAQRTVDEEVLYREALRLGLDRGDPIVRRRLVQKMEFLSQDMGGVPEPTEQELGAWLAAHAASFRVPARVRLAHVWFSRDARGDQGRLDALTALDSLRAAPQGAPDTAHGDAFLAGHDLPLRTEVELRGVFGGELPRAAMEAPVGEWVGPLPSAYGWHLVRVAQRTPERPSALAEVRGRVRRAVVEERRADANRALLDDLRARYDVRIEPSEASGAGAAAPVVGALP